MKKTCANFVNTLEIIYNEGITTQSALKANHALYNDFWFATREFVRYSLSSKTSGKNENGEPLPGNAYKIERLARLGATTAEDIENDCVIKIISKLNLVLKQPLKKQKNYCYRIVNNMVNDCFRRLPPEDCVIYLNEVVKSNSVDKEDACTYEDLIGDNTYNGETMFFEHETIAELSRMLNTKKAREQVAKREVIINEISQLSKRPAEVMVRLACVHLGIKPRDLSKLIIKNGCDSAYAEILSKTATKNSIELSVVRELIDGNRVTAESVKADSDKPNPEVVSSQISRLLYRAGNRIKK